MQISWKNTFWGWFSRWSQQVRETSTGRAMMNNIPTKKHRILVIDDETGFTRLLRLVLRRYDIREENDARRALETAQAFRPDLVLMDVVMPGIDGGNLAAKFKADALLKGVPIVFVTGIVASNEITNVPKQIGGYPFLSKPVCPEVLERCIEEHLTRE